LVGGASKISSSLLVQLDSLSSAYLDLSLAKASNISDTVTVATTSALLSISNQFQILLFDIPSGASSKISLVRSDSSEAGNCRTTHLSFPLSWYLDRELNYRWRLKFRNG
jgi:hypothetical protein